ncbi:MAG: MFS transporter [Marmoricola sp.]
MLLGIGAYIRLQVMETPVFERLQRRKEVATVPLRELLASQPRRLLLGMGTRFVEGFTYNLFSVYLLAYVVNNLGPPNQRALQPIMVGAALGVVQVVLTGALSDYRGRKPVYRTGAWAALLFAFPAAPLVQSGQRWALFVVFVGGLGVLYGVIYGPLAAFWAELFDTRYRFTALNTLYQVSGVVASSLTRSSRPGWSGSGTGPCGGWPATRSPSSRSAWSASRCCPRLPGVTSTSGSSDTWSGRCPSVPGAACHELDAGRRGGVLRNRK